jgi:acyl carrier protein
VELLGRSDSQVKISGRRIELGEIETRILKYPPIKNSLVQLCKDKRGEDRMVLYYSSEKKINTLRLTLYLGKYLPEYMVPSLFVWEKVFPMNASGKIDKAKLKKVEFEKLSNESYQVPKNLVEKNIVSIWQEVLGIEQIGRNDNFFQLGGHSLKLIGVYNRIEQKFPKKVSIAQMFSYPTVATLAEFISSSQKIEKIKKVNYKKKAKDLISQVEQGKISSAEAAKIFSKI